MPQIVSKRQFRLIQAVAHNRAVAKRTGMTQETAREGIAEYRQSRKNYASLPERAAQARKAGHTPKRRMR